MSAVDDTATCIRKPYTELEKWMIAVIAGLVAFVIYSTRMFTASRQLFSGLADDSGCPSLAGLIVHTIVFILIIKLLMR